MDRVSRWGWKPAEDLEDPDGIERDLFQQRERVRQRRTGRQSKKRCFAGRARHTWERREALEKRQKKSSARKCREIRWGEYWRKERTARLRRTRRNDCSKPRAFRTRRFRFLDSETRRGDSGRDG